MNPLRILIVEDDLITATSIRETLLRAGHQPTAIARNFREAVTALKNQPPDLVLLDIQLEDSSADDIATAEALLQHGDIPIIFLTANSENAMFDRAKHINPSAYLLKPFRPQELVMQVELAYQNYQPKTAGIPTVSDTLYLPAEKGYEKITKSDVVYLAAAGAYTRLFLRSAKTPRLLSMNLGYVGVYFTGDNFYQLSRSMIINLTYLERIEQDRLFMAAHEEPLRLPKKGRAELLRKLNVVKTR